MSLQMKRYISKGERNITQKGYDSCSTTLVPKGTILLTSRAPIGYISIAQNELCTNQGFKSLVCGDKVLPLFMYYWLSTKVDFLKSIANGATFKELSKQSLENVEIEAKFVAKRIQQLMQGGYWVFDKKQGYRKFC